MLSGQTGRDFRFRHRIQTGPETRPDSCSHYRLPLPQGLTEWSLKTSCLNAISLLTLKGVFTFTSFRLRDFTYTLSFMLFLAGIRLESDAGIVRSNKPRRFPSMLLRTRHL